MSDWSVGEATAAERESLLRRERALFGSDSALRAEWLFDRNPAGRALVLVARDTGGTVLGTRSLLPWRVLVDGREVLVGQYARTWTEPAHRHRGVSVAIGRELNRRSVELGYPILFLFPSVRSIPGHQIVGNRLVETLERRQVLGSVRFFAPWVPGILDGPVGWLRRRRARGVIGRSVAGPEGIVLDSGRAGMGGAWVVDPEAFATAQALWEARSTVGGVVGVRDAGFVAWRYSPDSGREYTAWRYPGSGHPRLLAFVHRAGNRARILDLWGIAAGDERAGAVAGLAERQVALDAALVEWCPPRHGDDPGVADRAGFWPRRRGVPLGLWFNHGVGDLGALADPDSYRLTEGDSDYA